MVLIIARLHVVIEAGDIRQNAEIGIVQDLVGVHPEDIRHGVGFGCGLQLGPVLVPAGDLYLDDHIGVLLGVGVADGLHALALGHVPDLEFEVGLAVHGAAAAQGQQQRQGQDQRRDAGDLFHKHHSSASFSRRCRSGAAFVSR